MWPLTGAELVRICGGHCAAPGLAQLAIAGVRADAEPPAADELFVALREPDSDYDRHELVAQSLLAGAALALVSADWSGLAALPHPLRERCVVTKDSLRAFQKLASWLRRRFPFPVIAVGGSNGKTTTKEMLAALLSGPGFRVSKTLANLNGHTGLPLTMAQRAHAESQPPHALVAEIGIDAPHAMAAHAALLAPDVAVITALGPEHLLRLGSWEVAAAEELQLFAASAQLRRVFQARDAKLAAQLQTARRGDVIVCDQVAVSAAVSAALGRAGGLCELSRQGISLLSFDVSSPSPLASEVQLQWHPAEASGLASGWQGQVHVPMAGRHNADNFAAAFGAALAVGRDPHDLLRGFAGFVPPAMRCQVSVLPAGGLLIDDTYNASPPSMAAALALLASPAWEGRRKVLLLGDMLDLGAASAAYHRALCAPLRALRDAHICLFGDAMREVQEVLHAAGVPASYLPREVDPCAFLQLRELDARDAVVLIKGSRGMRLERVVAALLRRAR